MRERKKRMDTERGGREGKEKKRKEGGEEGRGRRRGEMKEENESVWRGEKTGIDSNMQVYTMW